MKYNVIFSREVFYSVQVDAANAEDAQHMAEEILDPPSHYFAESKIEFSSVEPDGN
jgi:hypothetical protein